MAAARERDLSEGRRRRDQRRKAAVAAGRGGDTPLKDGREGARAPFEDGDASLRFPTDH